MSSPRQGEDRPSPGALDCRIARAPARYGGESEAAAGASKALEELSTGLAREDHCWMKGPRPVMHHEQAVYLNSIANAQRAVGVVGSPKVGPLVNCWNTFGCFSRYDPLGGRRAR